jgi:Zn-dependent M28 family amino/carboxypeptidase
MIRTMSVKLLLALAAAVVMAACAAEDPQLENALATINTGDLVEHIKVLSSDEYEGRLPSSAGEELTIAYLVEQFEKLGLQPGNGDSWTQDVPLVSITASPDAQLTVARTDGRRTTQLAFDYGDDIVVWTTRVVEAVEVMNSEMVFVGYGIVAPEYGWDDYAGLDVEGKTVVILVNDPGFATKDPELFTGNAMTYYGRWTYKYEEAARQGAAAALIVHETEPAAYGWNTVEGSWVGPQFSMVAEDNNMSRVAVEGWLTLETAREIFQLGELDYDELKAAALQRDFEAVPMGLSAYTGVQNTIERSMSKNVLAMIPGSVRPDELFIYTSHWDHLGRDESLEGDQIYNGALDNATGTASLLSLAKAFKSLDTPPERSILFVAVTAEEQGLLGSAYYGENPTYPLDKTAAAINIDGLNIYGPMNDIVVIGYGASELDDYLAAAAESQDRVLVPDTDAEKGYYYRSDHFSLAKQGVPALYTGTGDDHVEHGPEWTRKEKDAWTAQHYHRPSDEFSEAWDLTGAVDDIKLWFIIGYTIANESTFPNWSEGSEFKAIRDAYMGTH